MQIIKVILVLVLFNSLFLADDEFDSIFGESKPVKSEKKAKEYSDDIMDSLIDAENYNKQKGIFEELIKKAQRKAKKDYYKDAYQLLDEAYRMDFDNKRVSRIEDDIKIDERRYIRRKREEARRARVEEQRRREREYQEQIQQQAIMNSLNNSLKQQQQLLKQNQQKINRLISSSHSSKKTYSSSKSSNSSYKKTYSSSKTSYAKNTSNSEYEKKQKLEQEKKKQAEYEKQQKLAKQKKEQEIEERRKKKELAKKKAREEALAREKQKKEAEEKKEREKQQYLSKLRSGIKLAAINCYGEHHIAGGIPKYSPRVVECIDVYFSATCRNNRTQRATGFLHNMIGNSNLSCFGDTKKVEPKLNCKPDDYIVTVTKVKGCF